jgi:hypothetical protein
MFLRIAPQKVQSSDGYIVQVLDRYHVEYIAANRHAVIEVDFGVKWIGIFQSTLKITNKLHASQITSDDEQKILERIFLGVEVLGDGMQVELC